MASRYEIVFVEDKVQYDHLINSPDGEVGRHLKSLGEQLRLAASGDIGKKNGRLGASVRADMGFDRVLYVQVGSPLDYAIFFHEGTRPHWIFPRHGRALRFIRHGRVVYARRVFHPGTRPNRFLTGHLQRIVRQ